jgi:hypothetical protein
MITNIIEPTAMSNYILANGSEADRTLQSAEIKTVFPINYFSSDRWVSLVPGTNNFIGVQSKSGRAYNEHYISDLSAPTNFQGTNAFQLTYSVLIYNSYLVIPGFVASNYSVADKNVLSIGIWDGANWLPKTSTYGIGPNRLNISAMISEEGRYGIIVQGFSSSQGGVERVQVSSRLLYFNSPNPLFQTLHLTFPNDANDKIVFDVFDIYGKLIYTYECTGTSVRWDGLSKNKGLTSPGTYLWVIKVGGTSIKTYHGSFVIMGQ